MFTGLIEEIGQLKKISARTTITRVTISASKVLDATNIGDSIACNGVCLTVCQLGDHYFEAELMPETLIKTRFNHYAINAPINLERAVLVNTRLGGHIVTGHIDGQGKIIAIEKKGDSYEFQIALTGQALSQSIIPKGSIAIDGISLTVIDSHPKQFSVGIIPHTFLNTRLKFLKVGDFVNLETDIYAKYVQKAKQTTNNLSLEQLSKWGY